MNSCKITVGFHVRLKSFGLQLFFCSSIKFTCERDDGLSRSWIDHIICSQSSSSLVTDVYTTRSGCILSDHFPLCFLLHLNCSSFLGLSSPSSPASLRIDWSKATSFDIDNYHARIAESLLDFPPDVCGSGRQLGTEVSIGRTSISPSSS